MKKKYRSYNDYPLNDFRLGYDWDYDYDYMAKNNGENKREQTEQQKNIKHCIKIYKMPYIFIIYSFCRALQYNNTKNKSLGREAKSEGRRHGGIA